MPLKLLAVEQFLAENPQWAHKVVFAVIGVSASERGEDHKQTQADVSALVDRINRQYGGRGTDPVVYFEERLERDIGLAQRLAFFAAADVLMATAARSASCLFCSLCLPTLLISY